MNSRNSSDLGFSSASRSTFLHTAFPQRSWTPHSAQSRRLFAHTGGLTGSPLLLNDAPLPMLSQRDVQTEDGHAMMQADTFHSFQHLSQRERWCIRHECRRHDCSAHMDTETVVDKEALTKGRGSLLLKPGFSTTRVHVSPKTSCRQPGCEKVLSDGSWAGLSCVLSSRDIWRWNLSVWLVFHISVSDWMEVRSVYNIGPIAHPLSNVSLVEDASR